MHSIKQCIVELPVWTWSNVHIYLLVVDWKVTRRAGGDVKEIASKNQLSDMIEVL